MYMHMLMACNILLEAQGLNSIDSKLLFLSEENNAKMILSEATSLLNSKKYSFERRGFYSNPKTVKLIQ